VIFVVDFVKPTDMLHRDILALCIYTMRPIFVFRMVIVLLH
jgi:hypothetical protein